MEANENKQTRKEMFIRKTRQDKTEQENNKQKMKRKQCKDREREREREREEKRREEKRIFSLKNRKTE